MSALERHKLESNIFEGTIDGPSKNSSSPLRLLLSNLPAAMFSEIRSGGSPKAPPPTRCDSGTSVLLQEVEDGSAAPGEGRCVTNSDSTYNAVQAMAENQAHLQLAYDSCQPVFRDTEQ